MTLLSRARVFFRNLVHRSDMEREMSDELQFHLARRAEDLAGRRGLPPAEAMRIARLEFGSMERYKEEARQSLGLRLIDELGGDVRYAFRTFRRSKGFTAAAVATLALGIGANTAIFSLMDSIVVRRLPVDRPEELVAVLGQFRGEEPSGGFTNAIWEAIRDRQDVFTGVFASSAPQQFDLAQNGTMQRIDGVMVSGQYFDTLGITPAAGRLIADADDRRGCPPVAVLSHGFWRAHFGGSAGALGSTLILNRQPFQVIGVSGPGFYGMEVGRKFEVAVPLCASVLFDKRNIESRGRWWLNVTGRRRADVTPDQLKAKLALLSPAVASEAQGSRRFQETRLVPVSAGTGFSGLRDDFGEPLTMLMIAVAIVLLIACANLTGLMLARATTRAREVAVRTALGASRRRLLRQLLTESLLVSSLGAAGGLLIARWGAALLVRSLSTGDTPLFVDLSLDRKTLAFTAGIAVMTGIFVGLLPALKATSQSMFAAMRSQSMAAGARRSGFHVGKWIVTGQVALSLVLLIGGGLLLRTFSKLMTLDAGFDRTNVVVVNARAPWFAADTVRMPPEQRAVVYEEMSRRIRAIPGVIAVARSFMTPIGNDNWYNSITPDVANAPTGDEATAYFNFVTPGYFAALRTPLRAGRDLDARDAKQAPAVAIVNETLARRFFPGVNPLGRTFRRASEPEPVEIVGVVKDSSYESMRDPAPPTAFLPAAQAPAGGQAEQFVVRTIVPPSTLIPAIQRAMVGVTSEIPLDFSTLAGQVADNLRRERLLAALAGFFGGLALLLASIGLYGVLNYLVTHRQAEFGVRIALGAAPASILRLVMRDVVVVLTVGLSIGLALSFASVNVLNGMLFGLEARDTLTMATAVCLLSAMALLAGYLPARRATRVNPAIALRSE